MSNCVLFIISIVVNLSLGTVSIEDSITHIPFPSSDIFLARPSGRPFTITVQGNVGAGKSTLLNFFKDYPDISVYKEPLEIWQNLSGKNFLELVYQDQSRWGMTFQSLVTLTMLEIHLADRRKEGTKFKPVKVMERSVHSARHCFAEQLKPLMTSEEMMVLDSWYRELEDRQEFDVDVDLIVYLRTSPNIAMARVKSRNRHEENSIPLEYFQKLHQLHEEWLVYKNSSSLASKKSLPPVIIIDADEDISLLSKTYKQLAKTVWKQIKLQRN